MGATRLRISLCNSDSGHAIVIGASMGGLLVARVMAEHYERVTIIERDELPEAPERRKGVLQGQHTHATACPRVRGLEQLLSD
jgi:2-polyprenyl-6-methoxyphenol hydroxylase-like FAD-dependent oxidoreductase